MAEKPIRVAILGGGLAGAAAVNALSKIPVLDVHIFESAPVFRESGNAISSGKNALAAMDLLDIRKCFTASQPVQMHGTRAMIAEGKDAGKPGYLSRDNEVWVVQRSLFLTAMLNDIDPSRLHPSKKAKTIIQTVEEVRVEFEDGATHSCDILLGADGIHSTVRKYVVGENHASALPTFAGWYTVWTVVPFEDAQRHLGKDLINVDDPAQYAWSGSKAWLMHDQLTNNTLVNCVISRRVDNLSDHEPRKKTNKAELLELVKDFDHPIGKAMVDLLTSQKDEYDTFAFLHHNPQASRYVNDRVAIIGDAADSTTPWRGSGGAMSLEDALILSTCFKRVRNLSDARAALKAYEIIRKPRRQRLIMESYNAGLILCGHDSEVGLDAKKMDDKLRNSWDWILNIDLKREMQRAVDAMEDGKQRALSG